MREGEEAFTSQTKSRRSSKHRGYSAHVSLLPPAAPSDPLQPCSPLSLNPFPRSVRKRRNALSSHIFIFFSLPRPVPGSSRPGRVFFLVAVSRLRHENGRSARPGTFRSFLKDAGVGSALCTCARTSGRAATAAIATPKTPNSLPLSGESISDLENGRYSLAKLRGRVSTNR